MRLDVYYCHATLVESTCSASISYPSGSRMKLPGGRLREQFTEPGGVGRGLFRRSEVGRVQAEMVAQQGMCTVP